MCKCVTLKVTALSIAKKREKSSKTVEKSPGQLSTTCLALLGSTLVLSVAEDGCSPAWLLQLELIVSNLRHHLATKLNLCLNRSPPDLFPVCKALFIISPSGSQLQDEEKGI